MGKLTKFENPIWKIRREEEVFPANPCQSQTGGQAGEQFI